MRFSFLKSSLSLLFLGLGVSQFATAQNQQKGWGDEGEIKDTQVYVEKDININLPPANRSFEKVAPPAVAPFEPNMNYQLGDFRFNSQPLNPSIRVLTVKKSTKVPQYNNLLKGGVGNYYAPYLEGFLNAADRDWTAGAHVKHLSFLHGPVNQTASGQSENLIGANGKYFLDKASLGVSGQYQRNMYHFYGYNPEIEIEPDSIKQVFHQANMEISLEDKLVDVPFHYDGKLGVDYFANAYEQSETAFTTQLKGEYILDNGIQFRLNTDLNSTALAYDDSLSTNRTFFRTGLTAVFDLSGINVEGGVKVAYQNDTVLQANAVNIFPYIKATYAVNDALRASVELDGDLERNALKQFASQNPFIAENVILANTVKPFALNAKINGNIGTDFTYEAGAGYSYYKNMAFFLNQAADTAKFDVVYDQEGTNVTSLFAGFSYTPLPKLFTSLKGEYFNYGTKGIEAAWHKPTYKMTALASYDVYDKIRLGMDFLLLGGIQARSAETDEAITLNPVLDLGLRGDYRFSDRSAAFIKFSNLFNQDNYYFLNYPSRGVQVMFGGSYAF